MRLPLPFPARLRRVLAGMMLVTLTWGVSVRGAGQALMTTFDQAPLKDAVRSVLITSDGQLIAGANTLAAFDGRQWQAIPVAEGYGFRALAESVTKGRVYVGGIDTLGYLERKGERWQLTRVSTAGFQAGDVWSVHALADGAVWVGTNRVFRWRGAEVETLPLPSRSKLTALSSPQGVFVYQEGVGLLRVEATGAPQLVVPDTALPQTPLAWAVVRGSEVWLGFGEGAYRWDGERGFQRWEALSDELRGKVPTSAVALADGRVAIGTFHDGIVIADAAGAPVARIANGDGLGGVFALAGNENQLWVAQAQGLTRVDAPGRAWQFDRRRDLRGEMPRDVVAVGSETYLLGSGGVSRLSANAVTPVGGAPTVAWAACAVEGKLWVGGFGGIWRMEGKQLEHVHHVSTDVLCLAPSRRVAGAILFTEGYALKLLVQSPHGGWASRELGFQALDTPVSILEDESGQVWLATMKGGIYRFRWMEPRGDEPPALQFLQHYRPQFGLPGALTRPQLTKVGATVIVLAEEGIFQVMDGGQMVPVTGLDGLAGLAASGGSAEGYWLVQPRALAPLGAYGVVRARLGGDGKVRVEWLEVPGLEGGPWTNVAVTDEALWLVGGHGVVRVARDAIQPAPGPRAVRLAAVRLLDSEGQTLAEDTASRAKGVEFAFPAVNALSGRMVGYQTRLRLENEESGWSAPTLEARREFSQLAPGHYRFEARAVDRFGRPGPVTSYGFVIPVPWWRTPVAWVVYLVGAMVLVTVLARWRIRQLERQNARLNHLVAERTRELELSNTAKGEFLENISHEIRNPLNGLTGLLGMLKDERLDPRERELTRSLRGVANTLTHVFEDVLQFSKLEYGYAKLNPAPFRLRPLLQEVLDVFSSMAEQQGCRLALHWPEELRDGFVGDAERIRTVVANFVGNALKYAPRAPVEIRVSPTEEKNGHVDFYIDVTDHGPGIPEEEQGLIFRKFVRGSRAKEEQIPGTGLGLATCNVLARLMNGQVSVDSVPGKGATFSLRLLLPRASDGAFAVEREVTGIVQEGDRPLALVVDDEPYNRTVLEGLATELGFGADLTGNAREALEQVARRNYRVIFLDWELPGLKGGDVARQIRARPNGTEPIIFATTAHDSDEMQERCREAGMDGFLLKPFNVAAIKRALDGVTASRLARGSSAICDFWSEKPVRSSTGLDLAAFEQYARARASQPEEARAEFIRTLEQQMAALEGALADGDSTSLAGTAHRLRALAGLIRAEELNVASTKLEEIARKGSDEQRALQTKVTLAAGNALRVRLDGGS